MNIFINTKFDTYQTRKSGKHYVKVSFTEINGMFAVIGIVDDKKTSIQSFAETTNEHIYGLSSTNNYTEDKFYRDILPTLDKDTRATLSMAVNELDRSFRNHVVKNNVDVNIQVDVYREIKEFRTRFQSAINGTPVPVQTNTNDWKLINDIVNQITPQELNKIVDSLNKGGTAIFGNREYRISEENGRAILQFREVKTSIGADTSASAETIPQEYVVQKSRRKEKVAFMHNSTGLNEFVKGRFYTIFATNGEYVTLINEYGEHREINCNRVRIMDVFAEPPFEEAEVTA